MVKKSIIASVRKYLQIVGDNGISVKFGIIFGSHAKSEDTEWSDIDLIVVSPDFDYNPERDTVSLLWRLTLKSDNRIEPIAVGEKEWEKDDSRAIIEIARKEGFKVPVVELKM